MDPLSITCGVIGVMGVGGNLVQSSSSIIGNYRHAETQIKHAQCQLETLQSALEHPSLQSNPLCSASKTSLKAISERFPTGLRSDRKRARFRWAARDGGEVRGLVDRLKDTEISAVFALQLELL
jgi:hypothetical protein